MNGISSPSIPGSAKTPSTNRRKSGVESTCPTAVAYAPAMMFTFDFPVMSSHQSVVVVRAGSETDDLAHGPAGGEFFHSAIDVVQGDFARGEELYRKVALTPQRGEPRDVSRR